MKIISLLLNLIVAPLLTFCQESKATSEIATIPKKSISKINRKFDKINRKYRNNYIHYLNKFQNTDREIFSVIKIRLKSDFDKQLSQLNSRYANLQIAISKPEAIAVLNGNAYKPNLDTILSALKFLQQSDNINIINKPITTIELLQGNIKNSQDLKEYFNVRIQFYQQLQPFLKNERIIKRNILKLLKVNYYYNVQIIECKKIFFDGQNLNKKLLAALIKDPDFKLFMKKHSELTKIIDLQGNSSLETLSGLQSKSNIQSKLQQQLLIGGINAQLQFQQNISSVKMKSDQLKSKLLDNHGNNADFSIPNFKTNSQKIKPFSKRLEYGLNIQFLKYNKYLPSQSDLALSVGYKLNDNIIIGTGISYNMGYGTINKIHLSNQGFSSRSFIDFKFNSTFYLNAGYDINNIPKLPYLNTFNKFTYKQNSALVGISRKVNLKPKLKYELKILYDLLALQHSPTSQPFIFRISYYK